jgi:hypothetical protein
LGVLSEGIGSILFLKNGLKKKLQKKNYENNLQSNNYEVCTAVALCFPNILDVMVLENIELSIQKLLNRNFFLINGAYLNDLDLSWMTLSVLKSSVC